MRAFFCWILIFGTDFIEQHAQGFASGSDGICISPLSLAGIVELIALHFVDSIGKKPRDWIFVSAVIDVFDCSDVLLWAGSPALYFTEAKGGRLLTVKLQNPPYVRSTRCGKLRS